MVRHPVITCLLGVGLVTAACSKQEEKPLARVNGHYLYLSDIKDVLVQRSPLQDSAMLVKRLVSDWVKQQVLLDKAESSLSQQQKDKRKQVEEFRNSLLIYEYQRMQVDRTLDTIVTEEQVAAYFAKNKADFELKRDLVRLRYVKLPQASADIDRIRTMFRSESNMVALEQLCRDKAANYYLNDSAWLDLRNVQREIPVKYLFTEEMLKNNRYAEVKDEGFIYLVNIADYRAGGTESSPELEYPRIREMILNARKVKLMQELEQKMLKEAELNGHVEVY